MFQHTAARRRLVKATTNSREAIQVSTHSRPKAAGNVLKCLDGPAIVSTHSRPKAAGALSEWSIPGYHVSTHSRPKAAGLKVKYNYAP